MEGQLTMVDCDPVSNDGLNGDPIWACSVENVMEKEHDSTLSRMIVNSCMPYMPYWP